MPVVTEERRTVAKLIRFTPSELERVLDQAKASGRPVACFIREAALGSRPRMKNGSTVADALVHQLARLGTRLRALSRAAAERDLPNATEFDSVLSDLIETIRQIE